MATYSELRTVGASRSRNTLQHDVNNALSDTRHAQRRTPYARGNIPPSIFEDDSETQDPTSLMFRQQDPSQEILQELRELKELVKDVQKRQGAMEKTVKNLASKFSTHEFDVAKSSHAVSTCFSSTKN